MSNIRKHGIYAVGNPLSEVNRTGEDKKSWTPIEYGLEVIFRQMQVAGNRPRTIQSYQYIFNQFIQYNGTVFIEELNSDSIYGYLENLEVSIQTKKIRLKTIKAVLGKLLVNGWIKENFWKDIHIKVDKDVKPSARECDIQKLFYLIDTSTFIGLRDVTAIKLMFKTGIRIHTVCELKERHIDFEKLCLNLDGSTLKNHKYLKLPIDEEMADILKLLIRQNQVIRKHFKTNGTNVFITQNGLAMSTTKSSNCAISKQLNKYSKRFGLENINPHAIRRAFAKNLLDKGASVPLISKALGHSDLAVTTQYLDLSIEEVSNSLKQFL